MGETETQPGEWTQSWLLGGTQNLESGGEGYTYNRL